MNIEDGVIPRNELNMKLGSADPFGVVAVLSQTGDLASGAETTVHAS